MAGEEDIDDFVVDEIGNINHNIGEEEEMERRERRLKELNLIIMGIPGKRSLNGLAGVRKIFNTMQVSPTAQFSAKRLGHGRSGQPAPMLVKFQDGSHTIALQSRNLIMDNKAKVTDTRIRIHPDLTFRQRKALPLERKKVCQARQQGLWSELREGVATIPMPRQGRGFTSWNEERSVREKSLEDIRMAAFRDFVYNGHIVQLECPRIFPLQDDLLPGIPHDVTLTHIVTKLPWIDIHTLSLVNSNWEQAIRSREVYCARVRSHGTEPLAIIIHQNFKKPNTISLYSLRHRAIYELPPIPNFERGFPAFFEVISCDGRVYVFGGNVWSSGDKTRKISIKDVYVLDLAGQWNWEKCASMQQDRSIALRRDWPVRFGCGVVDGKIYVFGGDSSKHILERDWGRVPSSEVYDPKTDSWSQIMPMPMGMAGYVYDVTRVGDELFVRKGPKCINDKIHYWSHAYDPAKDEWRVLEPIRMPVGGKALFSFKGKSFCLVKGYSHRFTHDISVHDNDTDSWIVLQSISWDDLGANTYVARLTWVLPVKNELLALMHWHGEEISGAVLLQSSGFDTEREEIVWQLAPASFQVQSLNPYNSPRMCLAEI